MAKQVKQLNEQAIKGIIAEALKNILLMEDDSLWDYQDYDDDDLTDDEIEQRDRDEEEIARFDNPEYDQELKDGEEEYMWQHHGNQNIDTDVDPGWSSMAAQSPDREERHFGRSVRSSEADTEDAFLGGEDDFEDFE